MGGGLPAFGPASIAGAVAGVLIAIGSCLTWLKMDDGDASKSYKGLDGDGVFTLIAGIVVIVLFALAVAMRKAPLAIAAGVPGIIALGLGIWNIAASERLPMKEEDIPGEGKEMVVKSIEEYGSTGIGLYLLLAGAVLAVGVAVFILVTANRNQPRPYGR